jgi:hypothetical protein
VRAALLCAVAATALLVAGCGESSQVTVYKQGKYQGKPDSQPWDNAPLAYGSAQWTKGDQASWENQISKRAMGQNEDIRIYKQ